MENILYIFIGIVLGIAAGLQVLNWKEKKIETRIRISLSEINFRQLISGQEIHVKTKYNFQHYDVRMILTDIGYDRMLQIIEKEME
jgi:hypothetical protein